MDNNFFNNRLRELRKEHGLTQAQVAKALGLKLNTYSHMELDGKRPSLEMLQKISRIFMVSIESLTGEEKPSPYIYKIPEQKTYILHDHLPYLEKLHPINPADEPSRLRDLRTVEQDIILYYRSLPDEERQKVLKYLERTVKKNMENEEKQGE